MQGYPEPGMRVRVARLESTRGMLVRKDYLAARRLGVTGTATGWVPGHGGDVWWVWHDGSEDVGAYCVTELEEIEEADTPQVVG